MTTERTRTGLRIDLRVKREEPIPDWRNDGVSIEIIDSFSSTRYIAISPYLIDNLPLYRDINVAEYAERWSTSHSIATAILEYLFLLRR